MRSRSILHHVLALGAALVFAGCYLSHGRGETEDGGSDRPDIPSRPDVGPRPDGFVPPDTGPDAGPDARVEDGGMDAGPLNDAGPDAGTPGRDAEPPIPTHPDPTGCRMAPPIFPFMDPVMEQRWPVAGRAIPHADAVHVCTTPLVIDLEPEADRVQPQVVFVSYPPLDGFAAEPPGILRIWDPVTDDTVSFPEDETEMGLLEASTNLAAGDLDGDGRNEIVGIGQQSGTYAFRHDGRLLWESPYPTYLDRGGMASFTIGGAAALADLEGDGTVEVVVGRNVLEGRDGAHRWTGAATSGRGTNSFIGPISCVADLDGDGVQEVVAGRTAYRARTGEVYWHATNEDGSILADGLCAIAEMDAAHAGPEVVLVATGYVRMLDGRTGRQFWLQRLEGTIRLAIGGAPTVADFDGDGNMEFGVANGAAYAVYDPECRAAGAPSGCLRQGIRWFASTDDDSSSATGSSVFDFNGDGRAEVSYNDQYFMRVYDGITGEPIFEHRNSSRTRSENPTIADVDNDGDAEIVFSANSEASFLMMHLRTDPGVEIWGDRAGRWVGARRIWNQHAYHITNVDEDGSIPRREEPSWTRYNNYRQNLREGGGDVLVTPDLWGGRGSWMCLGGGRARLSVRVQNWGAERVGPGVVVTFWRDRPERGMRVGEAVTTTTLEPFGAGSETVSIDVSLGASVVDYWAVLDDPAMPASGVVAECREGNNDVLIWRPWCP